MVKVCQSDLRRFQKFISHYKIVRVVKTESFVQHATVKSLFTVMMFVMVSCEMSDINLLQEPNLDKLPLATREGKNTFGCLVNGNVWIPHSTSDFFATSVLAMYQMGVLQIWASIDEKGRHQAMSFAILKDVEVGNSYDLSTDPTSEVVFSWHLPDRVCSYDFDRTVSGKLRITKLDEVNGIVAGEFEFKTTATFCENIIVTEGRFDLIF